MRITLNRLNEGYHFEARNERGHLVAMDNTSEKDAQGASPMELLLMGIAGCSGIDIVSILKKQQLKMDNLRMEVTGERDEKAVAKVFTDIHLDIFIEGEIPGNKAQRAADLSIEKYCTVAKMLEKTAKISYTVYLNEKSLSR